MRTRIRKFFLKRQILHVYTFKFASMTKKILKPLFVLKIVENIPKINCEIFIFQILLLDIVQIFTLSTGLSTVFVDNFVGQNRYGDNLPHQKPYFIGILKIINNLFTAVDNFPHYWLKYSTPQYIVLNIIICVISL